MHTPLGRVFALPALMRTWWTQEILHSWHTNPKIFNRMSCNFKQCKTDWNQSQNVKCKSYTAVKPLHFTKVFSLFAEIITWMKILQHTMVYEIHIWIPLSAFFSDCPEFKLRPTSAVKLHFLFWYCSPASSLLLWKMVLEAVFIKSKSSMQTSAF